MSRRIRTTRQARTARAVAIARKQFKSTQHHNCRCTLAPAPHYSVTINKYIAAMDAAAAALPVGREVAEAVEAAGFEAELRTVCCTAEQRAEIRGLAMNAAKLGLRADDLEPMARAWFLNHVKPEAIEAGYQAVRDAGVIETGYPSRNAMVWRAADAGIRAALAVQVDRP